MIDLSGNLILLLELLNFLQQMKRFLKDILIGKAYFCKTSKLQKPLFLILIFP